MLMNVSILESDFGQLNHYKGDLQANASHNINFTVNYVVTALRDSLHETNVFTIAH